MDEADRLLEGNFDEQVVIITTYSTQVKTNS